LSNNFLELFKLKVVSYFYQTMGGLLKTIGYIVLFYFVMRVLRTLFEPKSPNRKFPKKRGNQKTTKGEFIEYEEVD